MISGGRSPVHVLVKGSVHRTSGSVSCSLQPVIQNLWCPWHQGRTSSPAGRSGSGEPRWAKIGNRSPLEGEENPYAVGENVNWYGHHGKQQGGSSKNGKQSCHMIQQSHSWAYTQTKLSFEKYIHPYVHVALFTKDKTWKQAKCPVTGMNKEDLVYIYNRILLSH